MSDQEQQHFPGQDSQSDKNRVLDASHLREKVFSRQGTGEEHRPDEQRLQKPVSQAGEHNRHQQDGNHPIGYDQKTFHRSDAKIA